MKIDYLVKSKYLLSMKEGDDFLKEHYSVAVRDDTIVDVGPTEELYEKYEPDNIVDMCNHLIMPGMVNCHNHLPMIAYRGVMPSGLTFEQVLFEYMFPLEKQFSVNKDFVYLSTLWALQESINSGVTTVADMYYHSDIETRAFRELGVRGLVGQTLLSVGSTPDASNTDEVFASIEKIIKNNDELVQVAIAPHAPYTVNDKYLIKCLEFAKQNNLHLLMHVNETFEEVTRNSPASFYNFRQTKLSPIEYLESLGFLNHDKLSFAHCTYTLEKERDLLKKYNVGVAYNPVCNCLVGSDIANIVAMRKAGINVGIGTDGPMTNDSMDLISQLRVAMNLQQTKNVDSTALTEKDVVKMVTIDAAKSLHLDEIIGSIEKGKKADIIGIKVNNSRANNLVYGNPYSFLVKGCYPTDVNFVMINGKVKEIKEPNLDKINRYIKKIKEK